jgi:hypothetical protein
VVVLEELHDSRAGQIQHAITLVRLHDRHGLKAIGLEGYLQDRPPVNVGWFNALMPGKENMQARAGVAGRLLKEGEISAAEFMKLTYDDVVLYPIEKWPEYNVEMLPQASEAMEAYLNRIKASRAQEIADKYNDPASMTITSSEEHVAMAEEIEKLAADEGIVLSPELRKGWDSWIGFWRARDASNRTMIDAVSKIPEAQDAGSVVAMNVGAAHTKKVCDMLADAGHPYAVITPLATSKGDKRGDLSDAAYALKNNKKSVFSQGDLATALGGFKKPETVLNTDWFKFDSSWRLIAEKVAERIASGGGGSPPYGFTPGELSNEMMSVDPSMITIVPDSDDRKEVRCALIPVTVKGRKDSLIIKALWSDDPSIIAGVSKKEEMDTEKMLRQLLAEVQQEEQSPAQAEDRGGRIRISANTVVKIGSVKESVAKARLTG